jgi:8-oxo-dGTP diphosphatase
MDTPTHNTSAQTEIVLAAGGVIERHTENGVKIAVIRRERYGVEWCLPKGKVQPGETLTDAARREIKEETGCDVTLVRFIETNTYAAKGGIKAVFYWLCHLKGECRFVPGEEVQELVWLAPEETICRLTHKSQQDLIRAIYCNEK